jgi:hypothetical protein
VRPGKEGEEGREEKGRKESMSGAGCAAPTLAAMATQPMEKVAVANEPTD